MGFGFGPGQIIILVLVVLLLFGKRIPETMKSLGIGAREFKKGLDGVDDEPKSKTVESEKKETSDTEA